MSITTLKPLNTWRRQIFCGNESVGSVSAPAQRNRHIGLLTRGNLPFHLPVIITSTWIFWTIHYFLCLACIISIYCMCFFVTFALSQLLDFISFPCSVSQYVSIAQVDDKSAGRQEAKQSIGQLQKGKCRAATKVLRLQCLEQKRSIFKWQC